VKISLSGTTLKVLACFRPGFLKKQIKRQEKVVFKKKTKKRAMFLTAGCFILFIFSLFFSFSI